MSLTRGLGGHRRILSPSADSGETAVGGFPPLRNAASPPSAPFTKTTDELLPTATIAGGPTTLNLPDARG